MLKKIIDFFTGRKPAEPEITEVAAAPYKVEAPATAPYKVPEPVATTPIPLVVTNSNPADNVPVVNKKKRTFTRKPAEPKAAKKPAAIKATPKPRVKKPPQ
jgi:hypothetical protein